MDNSKTRLNFWMTETCCGPGARWHDPRNYRSLKIMQMKDDLLPEYDLTQLTKVARPNWKERAASSQYQTAVAVRQNIQASQLAEADAGIEELIDALARSERRALKIQLARLMAHVLKWMAQPELRNRSWVATIHGAREEIKEIQAETPSLNDEVIRGMWDKCFELAKAQAEAETDREIELTGLTWEQVFLSEYRI